MQATNMVIADAQATPVNHTFVPMGLDDRKNFIYADQSAANEIGYWKVQVAISRPNQASPGESSESRVSRVKVSLLEPILEALSNNSAGYIPAPTVAYIPRVNVEFVMHERSTLLDRKNLRKMIALILGHADIIAVVENQQYLS